MSPLPINGNAHRFFEPRDPVPVGLPAVALRAGASVKRDGVDAFGFGHAGDVEGRAVFAPAHLDGERDVDGATDGADHVAGSVGFVQQGRAGYGPDDFLGRGSPC